MVGTKNVYTVFAEITDALDQRETPITPAFGKKTPNTYCLSLSLFLYASNGSWCTTNIKSTSASESHQA